MRGHIATGALALMLQATVAHSAGTGAEHATVGVELNKIEPVDGACRFYLFLDNRGRHTRA